MNIESFGIDIDEDGVVKNESLQDVSANLFERMLLPLIFLAMCVPLLFMTKEPLMSVIVVCMIISLSYFTYTLVNLILSLFYSTVWQLIMYFHSSSRDSPHDDAYDEEYDYLDEYEEDDDSESSGRVEAKTTAISWPRAGDLFMRITKSLTQRSVAAASNAQSAPSNIKKTTVKISANASAAPLSPKSKSKRVAFAKVKSSGHVTPQPSSSSIKVEKISSSENSNRPAGRLHVTSAYKSTSTVTVPPPSSSSLPTAPTSFALQGYDPTDKSAVDTYKTNCTFIDQSRLLSLSRNVKWSFSKDGYLTISNPPPRLAAADQRNLPVTVLRLTKFSKHTLIYDKLAHRPSLHQELLSSLSDSSSSGEKRVDEYPFKIVVSRYASSKGSLASDSIAELYYDRSGGAETESERQSKVVPLKSFHLL